ncbi:MAG: hypothetical protein AAGG46_08035 [Planctomycetota bacterium]
MSAPESPLQPFFRLTIMVGAAVVGGMALKVYGPPPEKIGPLVDQALAFAKRVGAEVMADDTPAEPTASPAALPSPAFVAPVATTTSAPPVWNPGGAAAPAAAPNAIPSPNPPQRLAPSGISPSQLVPSRLAPSRLAPARSLTPVRSPSVNRAVTSDPSLEPIVARLERAGVDRLELATWGVEGQLVRCSCSAPAPGSVFRRMLDAIDVDARSAMQSVLARLQPSEAIAQAY